MKRSQEIKAKVYYPTPENQEEYDKRAAIYFVSAIAKRLTQDEINQFIETLKKERDANIKLKNRN